MQFDWDSWNRDHIARHDVSTDEAEFAFLNGPVDLEYQDSDTDVHRYLQIGETSSGRILVILSTVRGSVVRIISAWDAPKGHKDFYMQEKARLS